MLGNSTLIPINQDGSYKFSYYAKVSGDVDHIQLAMWKTDDPTTPANTSVGFTAPNTFNGDYQLWELDVDLSAGDYVRLELGIDNNATGPSSVLFDSLELVNN